MYEMRLLYYFIFLYLLFYVLVFVSVKVGEWNDSDGFIYVYTSG